MKLITWNIQWARGIDLAVDPARIARTARKLADFDVLCLQEVATNFPGLPGSRGEDQVRELSRDLPGYSAHYGAAIDVDDGKGGRSLFGNVIFSRLPVMQVYRHLLPRPADPAVQSMQRVAVEAIIAAAWTLNLCRGWDLDCADTRASGGWGDRDVERRGRRISAMAALPTSSFVRIGATVDLLAAAE